MTANAYDPMSLQWFVQLPLDMNCWLSARCQLEWMEVFDATYKLGYCQYSGPSSMLHPRLLVQVRRAGKSREGRPGLKAFSPIGASWLRVWRCRGRGAELSLVEKCVCEWGRGNNSCGATVVRVVNGRCRGEGIKDNKGME
jgi:hypothetical protein